MHNQDASYVSELKFFERVMSDFSIRTLDRDRALLYYTPTWLTAQFSNIVYERGVNHYHQLVAALRTHEPSFNASWQANRSRHVFFLSGDKGACLWPRGPIYISHWGLTTPWKAQVMPHLWRADKLVSARAHEAPCADQRDVIVPPCCHAPKLAAAAAAASAHALPRQAYAHGERGEWACELLFAGAARAEQKVAKSSWCDDGDSGGVKCYSQAVRAAVFARHANTTGFCLAGKLPNELFRRARFCLAPSGEGFGDRLAAAVLHGCVPLIIQPGVRQPYDDVLAYDAFALRVGADAIPQLHTLLPTVTDAEHARLRAGVRRFARAFDWSADGGQAYEVARYTLCLRAAPPEGCAHLQPPMLRMEPADAAPPTTSAAIKPFADAHINGFVEPTLLRMRNGKVVTARGTV